MPQELDEKDLQILNLKHQMKLLGNALDEQAKRVHILYKRCGSLTKMKYCHKCRLNETCAIIIQRPLNETDEVLINIKKEKYQNED